MNLILTLSRVKITIFLKVSKLVLFIFLIRISNLLIPIPDLRKIMSVGSRSSPTFQLKNTLHCLIIFA